MRKLLLLDLFTSFLDRRTQWRFGRALYQRARNDTVNDIRTNGEYTLQQALVRQAAKSTEKFVIFDIGANVGDWTCLLLDEAQAHGLTDRLEIHAFEPAPTTFQTLKARLEKHPLGGMVRIVQMAMSDAEGTAELAVVGDTAGTNSLITTIAPDAQHISVTLTTFEAYCAANHIQSVHFAKCDTEGYDMNVLRGARALFAAGRVSAFQFEYNHCWIHARNFLRDAFVFAQDLPYTLGKVTSTEVEVYDAWHFELERFFEGNYLFFKKGLDWFASHSVHLDQYNTLT